MDHDRPRITKTLSSRLLYTAYDNEQHSHVPWAQLNEVHRLKQQLCAARHQLLRQTHTIEAVYQYMAEIGETYEKFQVVREWLAERPLTEVRAMSGVVDTMASQFDKMWRIVMEESEEANIAEPFIREGTDLSSD